MIRILSLGAGVQSSALLLMSCNGVLPPIERAIFADTEWEPPAVYEHLAFLEDYAVSRGIMVHRVSRGNLRRDVLEIQRLGGRKEAGRRFASMPLFVRNVDGSKGFIRRQCTREYKIEPIERFIRRNILGLKPRQRAPREAVVEQWFGITADEASRIKLSTEPWKVHAYPFCNIGGEFLPRTWTRADCLRWIADAGFPTPPRSACVGCPFHSDDEWLRIKSDPELWADAVEFDAAIRRMSGLDGDAYLHSSRMPLSEVRLVPSRDARQLNLFENECEGMCGV